MMPKSLLLLALLAADTPLTNAEMIERIPLPPIRFRGDLKVTVFFVEPSKLPALCGRKIEIGKTLLGCARWNPPQMFVTNPCLSLDQLYAKELCHELGHSQPNGWTEGHEE